MIGLDARRSYGASANVPFPSVKSDFGPIRGGTEVGIYEAFCAVPRQKSDDYRILDLLGRLSAECGGFRLIGLGIAITFPTQALP